MDKKELQVQQPVGNLNVPITYPDGELNLFNPATLDILERVAKKISEMTLIPEHFRNKPADCFAACYRAYRWKMDPFGVLEETYTVHGKLGIQSRLLISLVNRSGLFENELQYEEIGDESDPSKISCTTWAIRKGTRSEKNPEGIKCSATCSFLTAKQAGWVDKDGSHWKKTPKQMAMFRSAKFFCDRYCPELRMGMHTVEDLGDEYGDRPTPTPETTTLFTRPKEEPVAQNAPEQAQAVDGEVSEAKADDQTASAQAREEGAPVATHEGEAVQPALNLGVSPQKTESPAPANDALKTMRDAILAGVGVTDHAGIEQVSAFLVSINWLKEGELFESLSETYVKKLHQTLPKFKVGFEKYKAGKTK